MNKNREIWKNRDKNREKIKKNEKNPEIRNHTKIVERDLHASNAKNRIQFNRNVGGKSLFYANSKVFSSSFIFGRNLWHEPFHYKKFWAGFKVFGPKIWENWVFLGTNFEMSRFGRLSLGWKIRKFSPGFSVRREKQVDESLPKWPISMHFIHILDNLSILYWTYYPVIYIFCLFIPLFLSFSMLIGQFSRPMHIFASACGAIYKFIKDK